ncbi:hypothetical protein XELAEV_18039794mg [Xenopus laevis]|uniref:Uncharacterized protein n=1 Tax=Xenopus laevis TaxID=8355 RepID=A0A974H884_XENLA|nr:hypothetical protein XELAEV_18039794mg [Xenopus laevis]
MHFSFDAWNLMTPVSFLKALSGKPLPKCYSGNGRQNTKTSHSQNISINPIMCLYLISMHYHKFIVPFSAFRGHCFKGR